jgi:hypothetical protein
MRRIRTRARHASEKPLDSSCAVGRWPGLRPKTHQRTPLSQEGHVGGVGALMGLVPGPGGFRTIQVSPKDLLAGLAQTR